MSSETQLKKYLPVNDPSQERGKVCEDCKRKFPLNLFRVRQKQYIRFYESVCKFCEEK